MLIDTVNSAYVQDTILVGVIYLLRHKVKAPF